MVIRFAGGSAANQPDTAILIAPYVHHSAGINQETSGWAHVLLRRTIGLSMLNAFRIRVLNHLTSIQFRVPAELMDQHATNAYSYRLNTSYAPRGNWGRDVAALPSFDLIAGANDEAFKANAYETALSAHNAAGSYHILDDAGHLDVLVDDRLISLVTERITSRLAGSQ